ncbi:MAG: glycosyltransferase family 4 protein [Gemmatimonadales bacterium]|jgi:glycosyltransferase involved in cell wall biosynthesis
MKIAILTEYYPDRANPGSGVYVHTRASAYRAAGHEVRVYRPGRAAPPRSEYERIPIVAGDIDAAEADCLRFGADVVAVHTPYPGSAHTRLSDRLSQPRVVWIHGYEAMFTALHGYHRGLARALSLPHDVRKLWRLRRFLASSTAVVYVSQWMRCTAERSMRFAHRRTAIIPNPVDVQRFRPGAAAARAADRPRGLALRGLARKYGLDVAIAAFAGLQETELTIVGTGPDAGLLRRQIDASSAAVTLQERAVPHAEVPTLMNEYDYFVAPARTEAQGVAMCEAMACGLPVVAARAGGIPEFVRDGVDGYLVERSDAASLRQAVLALASDRRRLRAMGQNARDHVVERCAAETVIPAELELLSAAVEDGGNSPTAALPDARARRNRGC